MAAMPQASAIQTTASRSFLFMVTFHEFLACYVCPIRLAPSVTPITFRAY
jgi:hypothetical protein